MKTIEDGVQREQRCRLGRKNRVSLNVDRHWSPRPVWVESLGFLEFLLRLLGRNCLRCRRWSSLVGVCGLTTNRERGLCCTRICVNWRPRSSRLACRPPLPQASSRYPLVRGGESKTVDLREPLCSTLSHEFAGTHAGKLNSSVQGCTDLLCSSKVRMLRDTLGRTSATKGRSCGRRNVDDGRDVSREIFCGPASRSTGITKPPLGGRRLSDTEPLASAFKSSENAQVISHIRDLAVSFIHTRHTKQCHVPRQKCRHNCDSRGSRE